jgi:alpha-L-fucosidase
MTMTENSWGYHRTWSGAGWKTPDYLCELLTRCAAMNGNFLVNLGPKPDGTIRAAETARLNRIGDWLRVNGEAIYGTTAFPIADLPAGLYATRKGDVVYLIAFHWPDTDKLKLKGVTLASAAMLTPSGAQPVTIAGGDTLTGLPMEAPAAVATVFRLQLKNSSK